MYNTQERFTQHTPATRGVKGWTSRWWLLNHVHANLLHTFPIGLRSLGLHMENPSKLKHKSCMTVNTTRRRTKHTTMYEGYADTGTTTVCKCVQKLVLNLQHTDSYIFVCYRIEDILRVPDDPGKVYASLPAYIFTDMLLLRDTMQQLYSTVINHVYQYTGSMTDLHFSTC